MFGWLKAKAVDPINNPMAKATTPDNLIAAAILERMAKDWDKWSCTDIKELQKEYYWRSDMPKNTVWSDGEIVLSWSVESNGKKGDYHRAGVGKCCVNDDVFLDLTTSVRLYEDMKSLSTKIAAAKQIAADVKREMELNEKKWNLAEKLLGMKRLENGALVPANEIED